MNARAPGSTKSAAAGLGARNRPVATNILAALTGSASGGMTIALDALGETYMRIAAEQGINPALMHRVAAIGSGTLDSLPHNGAVVTLLAVCSSTHRESYLDIVMVGIVSALIALVAVIALGSMLAPSRMMGAQVRSRYIRGTFPSSFLAVVHSITAVREFRSCERKYSDM